jgi:hypothetical protein
VREFDRILEQLDWPGIYLVSPRQFESVEGDKLMSADGIASVEHPIITVRRGMGGKYLRNVLWHEVAHHLFPHRPHWWVEAFAEKMARGGGMGQFCRKYGHSVDDLPSRDRLLTLAKRAARRMNGK